MRKIICFLLILAVSHVSSYVVTWTGDDEVHPTSQHLLGQKMCTRGPSYWCHNITQAKECHAVHHCIDKVWTGMTLPEDNDSVCQICKNMVQQARDQLLSNETQDELRQVLEGSCNLLPLKIVAKECRELADEFIPELVDTLASRMDPQVVCAVSGLCNSARIDKMLEDMNSTKKFDLSKDSCPKCNYYMGKSIDFLKGLPENDLLEKGMMICGRLGSFSDSCSAMLFAHMDAIYSHLHSKVNSEEFCGLVGLCEVTSLRRVSIGEATTSVRVWAPEKDDDLPCDFCKQLVVHMKDWLVANTTKDEFRDLIKGICKQTGKYRKECLNLANQYGKTIYQLLIDETDPDRICGMIGVCPNTGKFQLFGKLFDGPLMTILPINTGNVDEAPMLSLLPAERMTGNEEARINSPRLDLVPAERLAGDDELERKPVQNKEICEFCELALNQVQAFLQDDKTERSIKDAVDKLCSRLPEELGDQCKQFLDNYADSFIALLAQEIDPSVICPKLGVCPGLTAVQALERKPIEKHDRRPVGDIPTCPLCHLAVHKLIEILGQNKTKTAIDNAIDSVCYLLPRHTQERCIELMQSYGNQIAEMIVLEGTAREICLAVHLCVWSQRPVTPPPKIIINAALPFDRYMPPTILQGEIRNLEQKHPELTIRNGVASMKGSGQQCVMCEFVMSELEKRLKDKTTEEEIEEEVEKICTYLPKSVSGRCNDFVEQYGDMIIQYLANSESPKDICTQLGLCGDSISHIDTLNATAELQKLNEIQDTSMGRCQLCIVLSDYLSAMLQDTKVETSIDRIAEKICPIMPSNYRAECKEMIEDYGPYIMSLVAQGTDKGKACEFLSICPKTA